MSDPILCLNPTCGLVNVGVEVVKANPICVYVCAQSLRLEEPIRTRIVDFQNDVRIWFQILGVVDQLPGAQLGLSGRNLQSFGEVPGLFPVVDFNAVNCGNASEVNDKAAASFCSPLSVVSDQNIARVFFHGAILLHYGRWFTILFEDWLKRLQADQIGASFLRFVSLDSEIAIRSWLVHENLNV